ncbi:hypothetical protein MNEG_15293 [Monoraphidium neglectum]|uniref:Uncharacterized protein n=1 Tax=Monoraphidium neglectum TaxID=145388 RepID=A0A0D2MBG9_9CHLO|nr:hypothetical protein MNEG_15293 [Monoraphidium neglectum]KIY92670.1 hypothetical protein MNEG_15293 [Monoraphidium neglectum]|eukprot:XP_013891690.1 hypothetical protein MNEG_15293 [Monoraphidium neglectum]
MGTAAPDNRSCGIPARRFGTGNKQQRTRHRGRPAHSCLPTKFTNDLKTLQAKHLGATLTYLAPANSLQLFSVSIDVNDPNAPPAPATSTAPNAANAAKPSTAPNAANAAKPSTAPNAANAAKPSTAPNAANAAKPSTAPNAANAAQLNARNLPIYTADGTPKPTTP